VCGMDSLKRRTGGYGWKGPVANKEKKKKKKKNKKKKKKKIL
jgi:hypothetical protein